MQAARFAEICVPTWKRLVDGDDSPQIVDVTGIVPDALTVPPMPPNRVSVPLNWPAAVTVPASAAVTVSSPVLNVPVPVKVGPVCVGMAKLPVKGNTPLSMGAVQPLCVALPLPLYVPRRSGTMGVIW